ncbi:UNVERIFIED_CONTAM: hypothetical protein K2H54_011391 [Gekko kuhli]
MARRAVPPSLWSGNERLRIGERLQASLAGLLELDLLRETQRETVERALERSQKDGDRQQGALQHNKQEKQPLPQEYYNLTGVVVCLQQEGEDNEVGFWMRWDLGTRAKKKSLWGTADEREGM